MRRFARRLALTPGLFVIGLALGCANTDAEPTQEEYPGGKADSTTPITPKPDAPGAALLADLAPVQTRKDGRLRLVNSALTSPGAADVLLDRLRSGNERSAVRQALAEALPRSNGEWQGAAVDLLRSESDAAVRVELVGTMRRAGRSQALEGLRLGFADADASVRATAARTTARHEAGAELADELVSALGDTSAQVRSAAARAAGALRIAAAADTLEKLTADLDADVRLSALRGLGRIDAARASAVVAASGLDSDDDERIRRVALRLSDK